MYRINELCRKIQKAEELMLSGEIIGDDYRRIKGNGEIQINILGDKITMSQQYTGNIDENYMKVLMSLLDSMIVKGGDVMVLN